MRTLENAAYVQDVLPRNQRNCFKDLCQQPRLREQSTPSTVRRGLNLFLHKNRIKNDKQIAFMVHLFDMWKKTQVIRHVWFIDEVDIEYVDKQNLLVWDTVHPHTAQTRLSIL